MKYLLCALKIIAISIGAMLMGYMLGFILYVSAAEPAPKLVKIAVIDSGYTFVPENIKLCPEGHRDFTDTSLDDDLGHGTAVASIISRYLPPNACLIIVKVFTRHRVNQMLPYLAGLEYVTKLKDVQYVNMSLTGYKPQLQEEIYIHRMLVQGKRILAASGNEGHNFDKVGCIVYPACYDKRIVIVGDKLRRFNHGRDIDIYELGKKQFAAGQLIDGTSMATAHAMGKLVAKDLKAL